MRKLKNIFYSVVYRLKKKRIKASKVHKLGNMVFGLCAIGDGLVNVLSLGNYNPQLTLNWSMYRRKTGKLCDMGLK